MFYPTLQRNLYLLFICILLFPLLIPHTGKAMHSHEKSNASDLLERSAIPLAFSAGAVLYCVYNKNAVHETINYVNHLPPLFKYFGLPLFGICCYKVYTKIIELENKVNSTHESFINFNKELTTIKEKVRIVEDRFTDLNNRISGMKQDIKSNNNSTHSSTSDKQNNNGALNQKNNIDALTDSFNAQCAKISAKIELIEQNLKAQLFYTNNNITKLLLDQTGFKLVLLELQVQSNAIAKRFAPLESSVKNLNHLNNLYESVVTQYGFEQKIEDAIQKSESKRNTI